MAVSIRRVGTLGERGVGQPLSTGVTYAAVQVRSIPLVVRWSFLLFFATLPFETADLGFMTGSLSIVRIASLLFFASYFFYFGFLGFLSGRVSLPGLSRPMWWFLGFLAIFALHGLFEPIELRGEFRSLLFTLTQLLVFFWITSDLLKEGKMARAVLLAYSIAAVFLAVGVILDLPGFVGKIAEGRSTALGDNPNVTGQHMTLAALIFIGLVLNADFGRLRTRILTLVLTIPPLMVMVSTGSRAAVGGFIIACSVYLLSYWRSKRVLKSIILATAGISATLYIVTSNLDFLNRWEAVYYEGKTAGRDQIYGATIEMIMEQPIFGWGPVSGFYELGLRLGLWSGRDAHNLFLDLLLGTGLVGATPFLVGLWLCGKSAWGARTGALGLLPLALLVANLVGSMSHTYLIWKPQWFVLALTLAAASHGSGGSGKKPAVVLTSRSVKSVSRSA